MNSLDVQEILQKARKRKLDETAGAVNKTILAKVDFEYRGRQYLQGEEYEIDEGAAKELIVTGQIELWRGGYCDTALIKRIGRPPLFAYRPWHFESPGGRYASPDAHPDPHANTMVRVRLNKSVQIIPGNAGLKPGHEFYLPFADLCHFEFDMENDPNPDWLKTFTVLTDQE